MLEAGTGLLYIYTSDSEELNPSGRLQGLKKKKKDIKKNHQLSNLCSQPDKLSSGALHRVYRGSTVVHQ